jgi:uncharacterized protein YprB with RNaseH-like and TPR domain
MESMLTFGYDIETNGLDPFRNQVFTIQFQKRFDEPHLQDLGLQRFGEGAHLALPCKVRASEQEQMPDSSISQDSRLRMRIEELDKSEHFGILPN